MNQLKICTCKKQVSKKNTYVLQLLTAALLSAGLVKTCMTHFPDAEIWWLFLSFLPFFLTAVFLAFYAGRWRKWVIGGSVFLGILVFLAGFSGVRNGVFLLANQFLDFMTGKTGRIWLDYPAQGEKGLWLFLFLLCYIAALLMGMALGRNQIWPVLFLAAPCLAGILCGFFKADAGLVLLTVGCFLLLMQKQESGRLSGGGWKTILGLLPLLFCCLCVILLFGVSQPEIIVGKQKEAIQEIFHEMRYKCGRNAMPEGQLSDLGMFQKSEKTALAITMDIPQKLYLRGRTGEIYTGTSWEGLDEETRIEAEDLFYWLHRSGFSGQTSVAQASAVTEEPQKALITIQTRGACGEYQYLPYALCTQSSLDFFQIGDESVRAGTDVQELYYYTGSVPEWYQTSLKLYEQQNQDAVCEYLKNEQSYREFVYEQDLQLTNAAVGVCKRLLGEDTAERSLFAILELVRSTLESRLSYNEVITTPNGSNDFFQYTMEQNKQGYSVHYATAATLLLRYCGVPARYVEGYFLSAQEASQYQSGEMISLDEGHAHAWTEYYLDGVGWIPFETTPGYIDEEEIQALAEAAEDGQAVSGGNGKSYSGSHQLYTPPVYPEEKEEHSALNQLFRFRKKILLWGLLFLLAILLLWRVFIIEKRRKHLKEARKQMAGMENREAIMAQFGYASMLMGLGNEIHPPGLEEMQRINQEAVFSTHPMTEEQRQKAEAFILCVLEACKASWSVWKRFRYHYILWLYS